MKKNINLTDDLDNAFNKAIEPMEIEPSESVWKNVDAGLTRVENSLLKKKIIFWKKIAASISVLLFTVGIFFFYQYSSPESSKQLVKVDVPESKLTSEQQQTANSSVEKEPLAVVSQKKLESLPVNSEQEEKKIVASTGSIPTVISENNSAESNLKENNIESEKKKPATEIQSVISTEVNAEKNHSEVSDQPSSLNTNKINNPKSDSTIAVSEKETQQLSVSSEINHNTLKDSAALPKCNEPLTGVASANPSEVPNTVGIHTSAIFSHIYVEGIFSPEITKQHLKDNESSDIFTKETVKTHEVNLVSHSEGIKFGYDINHWSIETGCIYYQEHINILPSTIAPYELNGEIHSSLVTSSGVVDIPLNGAHHISDSVDIKSGSNQVLSFVNIPIQVKYRFGGKKLSFYVMSGISANVLTQEKTNLKMDHDHDQDDGGDRTVIGIKGTKNVFYGYSLGMGASYKCFRGFYLNLEPLFRGAMTSLNKDTPIKTYPNTFGIGIIAGYHF